MAYPNPLPSSGQLSLLDIYNWMVAAGEWPANTVTGGVEFQYVPSLDTAVTHSHLTDKTVPYKISDFYGYRSINKTVYPHKWVLDNSASYCEVTFASSETGIIVVDIFGGDINSNFASKINTSGVTISNGLAYTSKNFVVASDTPANAWMLASDYVNDPNSGLRWRFQFNVAKLMAYYPSINVFTMQIIGRTTSYTGPYTGSYVFKSADQGNMTMQGTPGSYIPSVENATNLGIQSTTFNVTSGANGVYNDSLPLIKTFTYNKSTKVLTVS